MRVVGLAFVWYGPHGTGVTPMDHELNAPGGLVVGARRFVLERMADPKEPVTLIAPAGPASDRWVVRTDGGLEFVVASDHLSPVPAEEFYRGLARLSGRARA